MYTLRRTTNKALRKFLLILAFGAFSFHAQSQLRLGGGIAYGSEIDEPGINLRAGALIGDNFLLGADMNYFFPGDDGFTDVDVIGFNLNGSLLLLPNDDLYVYPMAGLNITQIHTEFGDISNSNTEMGLNLGFGLGLNLGLVHPFAEAKYVLSDYDQLVLTAGIVLSLGD